MAVDVLFVEERKQKILEHIAAHRKAVMPIALRHDFEDVIAAAADHARATLCGLHQ